MQHHYREFRELAARFAFERPAFSQWVLARARELAPLEPIAIVVRWGRWLWDARQAPRSDPVFCIRRRDGSIERSPYA